MSIGLVTSILLRFHAYGHEAKCQVLYNPQNKIDFDGEWLKRLWSYPGRFAKITCIMTPSIDPVDTSPKTFRHIKEA